MKFEFRPEYNKLLKLFLGIKNKLFISCSIIEIIMSLGLYFDEDISFCKLIKLCQEL